MSDMLSTLPLGVHGWIVSLPYGDGRSEIVGCEEANASGRLLNQRRRGYEPLELKTRVYLWHKQIWTEIPILSAFLSILRSKVFQLGQVRPFSNFFIVCKQI